MDHFARHTAIALVLGLLLSLDSVRLPSPMVEKPDLTGTWTLNRALSEIPAEIGFGMDLASGGAKTGNTDERMGGGGAPSSMLLFKESIDDAKRRDQLIEEARTPPVRLSIVQTDVAITVTTDKGKPRVFHPVDKAEFQSLDGVSVLTMSRWTADRLEVRYLVEPNREIQYTFSRTADPLQLVVQVRFVERNGRLAFTLVYEPAKPGDAGDPARPAAAAQPSGVKPPAATTPPAPPAGPPAAPAPAMQPIGAIRPDAELQGLKELGVLVTNLSQQAGACVLDRGALESSAMKSLGDAGLKPARHADEDSYLEVRIITTALPGGLCVSSYDVILYSYTTTTLPYQTSPVRVQAELAREGGMAGGSPASHSAAVSRNVRQLVDQFAARIRAAGK